MSCNDADRPLDPDSDLGLDVIVEREIELPVPPPVVWDELPAVLGDEVELVAAPGGRLRTSDADGERIGVVHEAVPAERLAFRWARVDGDDAASEVEITLEPAGAGTILHLRETRLDGGYLERSAPRALARV